MEFSWALNDLGFPAGRSDGLSTPPNLKADFEEMDKNEVLSFMDLEPRNILVHRSPHSEGNSEGKGKYEVTSIINGKQAKASFQPLEYEILHQRHATR